MLTEDFGELICQILDSRAGNCCSTQGIGTLKSCFEEKLF